MKIIIEAKYVEAALNIIQHAVHKNLSAADVNMFIEEIKKNCNKYDLEDSPENKNSD